MKNKNRSNTDKEEKPEVKETIKDKIVSTVKNTDKEEETKKIFNLSDQTNEANQTTNKKVITDPVKAWGKPR